MCPGWKQICILRQNVNFDVSKNLLSIHKDKRNIVRINSKVCDFGVFVVCLVFLQGETSLSLKHIHSFRWHIRAYLENSLLPSNNETTSSRRRIKKVYPGLFSIARELACVSQQININSCLGN